MVLEAKQIKLLGKHKIPSNEGEVTLIKWHNSIAHATNKCILFRISIHDKIDRNILKFPNQNMEVDENPFPLVGTLIWFY